MYLYAELWNAGEEWLALSTEERQRYVESLQPGLQQVLESGVQLLGFVLNDAETPHRSDHRYLALWQMDDLEQVNALEEAVEEVGFHRYFDQVNARGRVVPPEEAFGDMIRV